jgi:hypothetical protein
MSDAEVESNQLVPTTDGPLRAVAGAAKWRRNYNRVHVRKQTLPTGANMYVLTEAGRAAVREASAGGMALGTIARNVLGISACAFEDMRKRDQTVQELVEYGREMLSNELYDILLDQARSGVVASAIFLARSRAGFVNDGGSIEGMPQPKVVNNTQINIQLVEPLTPEQFRQITQGAQANAADPISTSGVTIPPDSERR